MGREILADGERLSTGNAQPEKTLGKMILPTDRDDDQLKDNDKCSRVSGRPASNTLMIFGVS
jgi:hypothetical protein